MQTIQVALTFPALGIQKTTPSVNTDALVAGVSLLAQVKGPSLAKKKKKKEDKNKEEKFSSLGNAAVSKRECGRRGKRERLRERKGRKKEVTPPPDWGKVERIQCSNTVPDF